MSKVFKRCTSALLSLVMILSMMIYLPQIEKDPSSSVSYAADTGGVALKIAEVQKIFPHHSYFTTDGKPARHNADPKCCYPTVARSKGFNWSGMNNSWSCCAFAHFTYRYIFGHEFNTNGATKTSTKANSTSNIDNFLKNCQIGDVIHWKYNGTGGCSGDHWVVFLSYSKNTLYCYDCNIKGTSIVTYNHAFPVSWILSRTVSLDRHHAKNYDEVNKTTPQIKSVSASNAQNTDVTITPQLANSHTVLKWTYFLSTDKDAVSAVNATKTANHKSTDKIDCVRALDYSSSPKFQNKTSFKISKYKGNALSANTVYYYRVACMIGDKWYQTSVNSFTTANIMPGTTALKVSKGNEEVGIGDQVTLLWDAAVNAQKYSITVKDADGNTVQVKEDITGLTCVLDGLENAGKYAAEIKIINDAGSIDGVSTDFVVKPDITVNYYDTIDSEGAPAEELIHSAKVHYGHNADPWVGPSHEGHTFTKWDKPLEALTEDTNVYASYDKASFTVKFIDTLKNQIISTQKVKYKEAATAPEISAEGYIFSGWDKDITAVTSDMTVYSVFEWGDKNHPVTINVDKVKKVSTSGTEQGYDITVTLTNHTSDIQSGRVVALLKSNGGIILSEAESAAFAIDKISEEGTESKTITFMVPYAGIAPVIELYVIDGYDSLSNIAKPVVKEIDNSNLTDWTDYITYIDDSELPVLEGDSFELEKDVDPVEKYFYRIQTKDVKTSTATSMDGYIKDGYSESKTSSGTIDYVASWPSGFYTSNANYTKYNKTPMKASSTDTQTVTIDSSSTVGYIYWHWCKNAQLERQYNRGIEYKKTSTYNTFHAFFSTKNSTEVPKSNDAFKFVDYSQCHDSFWWGKIPVTRQTYSVYNKIYNYYQLSNINDAEWIEYKEGDAIPKAGDVLSDGKIINEVETKTVVEKKYRYRVKDTTEIVFTEPEVSENRIIAVNGKVNEEFAGLEAVLWIYKYTQASNYTLEYAAPVTIGEGGTVAVDKAVLREAPTAESGDYTIVVSVEGQSKALEIGKIDAPKASYTVTFYDCEGNVIDKQKVTEGKNAVLPEVAAINVPVGYRFTTWSESVVNVRSDMNITPVTVPETYSVAFVNWEKQTAELKMFNYGDSLVADSAPEGNEGFVTEWVVKDGDEELTLDEFNEAGKKITGNMIVGTRSTPKKYTVTFIDITGEKPVNEIIEEGKELDIEELNVASEIVVSNGDNIVFEDVQQSIEDNPDIIFLGWINAETNEPINSTEVYSSAVIYPSFVYDQTAAAPEADVDTGEYDSVKTVTLTSVTENAVIWYTTDGSDPMTSETAVEYTAPIEISKSCILRAYTGAFNCNDSEEASYVYAINNDKVNYHIVKVINVYDKEFEGNDPIQIFLVAHGKKLKNFESTNREGYKFDSLYFDEALTEQYFETEEVVGESTTLYAKYEANTYTVSFIGYDGTVVEEQKVKFSASAKAPEAPAVKGFVFVEWDGSYENIAGDTTVKAVYIPESAYAEVKLNRTRDINLSSDGAYTKLKASITPESLSAYELEWSSSDKNVAEVNEDGSIIKAVGVGSAVITVRVKETGATASIKVNVIGLSLASTATAGFDSERNLRNIKPEHNTAAEVLAQFDNEDIAVVDAEDNKLEDTALVGTGARVCLYDVDGNVLDSVNVIVVGDYTGDGKVNNKDVVKLNTYVAGTNKDETTGNSILAVDVNGDGSVNNRDCAMLSRYLVGKQEL